MKRRVAVALAVAAAAVVLENVLYMRSSAPPAGPVTDAEAALATDAGEGQSGPAEALGAVSEAAIRDYLAALPAPERARNPFLTRAEADALAESGSSSGAADGPRLAGTLISAGRRVAWLDGIATSEGDFVGALELVRIEARSVVLSNGTDELRIDVRAPAEAAVPALDDEPLPIPSPSPSTSPSPNPNPSPKETKP